jgi:hypothetical protein
MRIFLFCVVLAVQAFAHRLDEYLQATLVSVEKDRVQLSMRLIPGVAVYPVVLATIDTNGDGVFSETEQRAYALRVLQDLSLTVDGQRMEPRLVSLRFPDAADLKEGLGEIHFEFAASLPAGGRQRRLSFENHHLRRISAYLVNCLVPQDRNIQVTGQDRNYTQSFYQVAFVQAGGFASMFRLGMRHIAEGTDHLLFLLTLLLAAPRPRQIFRVVTAFTIGHSLTLALAALGVVHVPSRPIEVLIEVSILVSAAHVLWPIFPGREAAIAGFFGLIHGLAFATTISDLGLSSWDRIAAIFGFNLGIETMQLMVVAAVLPALIFLSRRSFYPVLKVVGAVFAGGAAVWWIAERALHALWMGASLLAVYAAWLVGNWATKNQNSSMDLTTSK